MTEKEFFEALAEVPGKWTFHRFGIRQVNWVGFRCHCPLTAVAAYRTGRSFKTHDFDIAARDWPAGGVGLGHRQRGGYRRTEKTI